MIVFSEVRKSFGGLQVLSGLSFEVPKGKTYALLGLSGSGKSTALKIACGLCFPDNGTVHLDGTQVIPENLGAVRQKIGYVTQDGGLFPHMTAWQNLSLIGKEAKWPSLQIKNRIEELAATARLSTDLFSKYPRQLSTGQRQRVGLMRALMRDPPVLLLDEPMGALDPITRDELQKELAALFSGLRKTVLLVTHDLVEASKMADMILLLNDGRILQKGRFVDLVKKPEHPFVQRFVESQSPIWQGDQ